MTRFPIILRFACIAAAIVLPIARSAEPAGLPTSAVRFSEEVRPILSDNCFACHGPDEAKRKAKLRLDTREGILKDLGGHSAVIPADPEASELIKRVYSDDPDYRMPPSDTKLSLTDEERFLISKWIEQGAQWEAHWSFIKPERTQLSEVARADFVRNPIDRFVVRKLVESELEPSREASKERLLRRVTIDLTGLPPSIEEIDSFLTDESPDAYERRVDQLLQTDAYGERMALDWMDVARYADSHGMHADGWRLMWPWRDWVINAFKNNLPYDQFVTWQLAGDLMPNKSRESVLATAFHRNHPMTAEGGVIDEEFRLQYVFDRAQTTATAFLGMTFECARCHDHKFDPVSQKDYYRLTAFFNNVKELGMTGDDGNYGPMLMLPSNDQESRLENLNAEIRESESKLDRIAADALLKFDHENYLSAHMEIRLPDARARFPLDSIKDTKIKDDKTERRIDGNVLAKINGQPELVDGVLGKAFRFDNEYDFLTLAKVGLFDLYDPYSVTVWIYPEQTGKVQAILGTAGNKNNFWRGWDFFLDEQNRLSLKLINSLPHNYLHVESNESIAVNQWSQIAFTYDGSGKARGATLYADGQPLHSKVLFDQLYKSIYPVGNNANRDREDREVRVGKSYRGFTGEFGIFKGKIDDIQIFDVALTPVEVSCRTALPMADQADSPSRPRTIEVASWKSHTLNRDNAEYQKLQKQLRVLRQKRLAVIDAVPEIMVMEEMPEPRTTHVLKRGQYDSPQDPVSPGTPDSILPFTKELPANRLGLAQWLLHPDNPLTARVTVNRYWQLFFGIGLVETTEDFGSQGSPPSHPELLDWLAVDFMESGWDVKHLVRQIVLSGTYRQSSEQRPDLIEKDPRNRLLARGPSYRLPAEFIRDGALAASGLLVREVGGPSVKPYQPEGLWIDKGNFSSKLLHYKEDEGSKLYRRSLYTFVRRTSPPPAMTTFDAPTRDVCTVRREITNTPLQALILMNDPQFLEAARILAERMQQEGGQSVLDQITYAVRSTTGRRPSDEESRWLAEYYENELERFQKNGAQAEEILTEGKHARNEFLDPAKTAAFTMVANTLMNFDEFYMKR